jgi:hypothetical protein
MTYLPKTMQNVLANQSGMLEKKLTLTQNERGVNVGQAVGAIVLIMKFEI